MRAIAFALLLLAFPIYREHLKVGDQKGLPMVLFAGAVFFAVFGL